jgi:hypothetical protein
MEKNVGKIDAIIRLSLAAVSVIVGVVVLNTLPEIAIVLFAVAVMLILTSLVGRCGLYKVFGINTCPIEQKKQ